jgi:mannosyltransferase OCH1-like enzyme
MADIFQTFWYGGPLSPYEWLCIKSFVDRGHRFYVYTYDQDINVPEKVVVCDASEIIDRSQMFFYRKGPGKGSVAAFANLFRYLMLNIKGGWWVDTDVVCLSRSIPDSEMVFGWEQKGCVNNAILKLPPQSPLGKRLAAEVEALGESVAWGEGGPQLLTRVLTETDIISSACPEYVMYPIHWADVADLFLPERREVVEQRIRNSTFIHLWNEMIRRRAVQKNIAPPEGSYLRSLFEKHNVEFPARVEYDVNQLRNQFDLFDRAEQAALRVGSHQRLVQSVKDRVGKLATVFKRKWGT